MDYIAFRLPVKGAGAEKTVCLEKRKCARVKGKIYWRRAMDFFILVGVFAVWFILNRWILPKLGVST